MSDLAPSEFYACLRRRGITQGEAAIRTWAMKHYVPGPRGERNLARWPVDAVEACVRHAARLAIVRTLARADATAPLDDALASDVLNALEAMRC